MKHFISLFGTRNSSTAERRLIAFSPLTSAARAQQARERMQSRYADAVPSARRKLSVGDAATAAADSVHKPFGGRADAPPIDEDYAELLAEDSIRRFMEGKTLRKDPEMMRVLNKAYALMEVYPELKGKPSTQLVFGWEGRLVVKNLDTERQEWALTEVADQIRYLEGSTAPTTDIRKNRYESDAAFQKRKAAVLRYKSNSINYDPNHRAQQVKDWQKVEKALMEYNSDFATYRDIRDDLAGNPTAILDVEKKLGKKGFLEWGKKYPALYRKAVREAALLDPSVLEGREKDFVGSGLDANAPGMFKYFTMLDETFEDQPMALIYYPARLKRVKEVTISDSEGKNDFTAGLENYQDRVIDKIGEAPRELLAHVISEHSNYWKDADKYTDAVAAAVNADPDIFLDVSWNKSGKVEAMKTVFDKISDEAKATIYSGVDTIGELVKLNELNSEDFAKTLTNALAANPDVVALQIAKNKELYQFLRVAQPELFENINDFLASAAERDADIRELIGRGYIGIPEPKPGEPRDADAIYATDVAPSKMAIDSVRFFSKRTEDLINWEENTGAFELALEHMDSSGLKELMMKPSVADLVAKNWDKIPTKLLTKEVVTEVLSNLTVLKDGDKAKKMMEACKNLKMTIIDFVALKSISQDAADAIGEYVGEVRFTLLKIKAADTAIARSLVQRKTKVTFSQMDTIDKDMAIALISNPQLSYLSLPGSVAIGEDAIQQFAKFKGTLILDGMDDLKPKQIKTLLMGDAEPGTIDGLGIAGLDRLTPEIVDAIIEGVKGNKGTFTYLNLDGLTSNGTNIDDMQLYIRLLNGLSGSVAVSMKGLVDPSDKLLEVLHMNKGRLMLSDRVNGLVRSYRSKTAPVPPPPGPKPTAPGTSSS